MTQISITNAFKDFFTTPKKWPTFWCIVLCNIIPVAGPMVAMGYFFQRFTRVRNQMPAPDFDFNQFGDYLKLGLWPFLASMVASLIILPFIVIAMILFMVAAAMAENSEIVALVCGLFAFLFYLAGFFVIGLVSAPVLLSAGIQQDFKSGFNKAYIIGFIKNVGMKMIGTFILFGLMMIIPMLILYFTIVGLIVAGALVSFAMYHLYFQFYDLNIERGGQQLPVAPELLTDPPQMPSIPNQPPPTPPAQG